MRKSTIVLACLFLVVATALDRLCSQRLDRLKEDSAQLERKLKEAEVRARTAVMEKERYERILEISNRIDTRIVWESDSTNLLRRFADIAAETGVKLTSGKMEVSERANAAVSSGNFKPLKFDLRLEGAYWPLVRYIERIENSSTPILIESMNLTADRMAPGEGSLHLVVTNLFKLEKAEAAPKSKEKAS